jgi:hypothetical protein
MHTDAQQTAELHAIPAFAEWARARGFRVGDWVWCESEWHKGELLVIDVGPHLVYDDDPCEVLYLRGVVRGDTCGRDPADCRLMPSESDLMDFLDSTHEYWSLEYLPDEYEGLCSSVLVGDGDIHQWSDTRIGALVAAVVAVEGEGE